MSKERVSWNTYFMNIAREVSTRSTCSRKHVGAVIVRNKTPSVLAWCISEIDKNDKARKKIEKKADSSS